MNLGIAAQTDRGLVVPSVRDAHLLSARGLDAEIRRLTAAARNGSATATDLTSGSFTLNNYGVLGVDGSAAIINHHEVAILGMGRIIPRPWVVDGNIVVRRLPTVTRVRPQGVRRRHRRRLPTVRRGRRRIARLRPCRPVTCALHSDAENANSCAETAERVNVASLEEAPIAPVTTRMHSGEH